jgi:hypothetical protein
MAEMAYATKHHRNTALIGGINYLLVAHRSAGLNDAGGTCIDHYV